MQFKFILLIFLILATLSFSATIYDGFVSITIENEQKISMTYKIGVEPSTFGCVARKCYKGWVEEYTTNGTTVEGFENRQLSTQPVFEWKGNSSTDYSLTYPEGLDKAWKSIIELWSEKFNPFSS